MLPATELVIKNKLKNRNLNSKTGLFIIQHLREDTEYFVNLLINANFPIIKVFGIEYSSKFEVLERLRARGIDVNIQKFYKLKNEIRKSLEEICQKNKNVLIHEVGGYFADIIKNIKKDTIYDIIGVIEETKQGLWRYEKIKHAGFPTIQIADSNLKNLEGKYIGDAVALSIENDISALGLNMKDISAGVSGYGIIGSSVADALRIKGINVSIYDPNPVKQIEGRLRGFRILEKDSLLRSSDIIIGSSGRRTISFFDLEILKNDIILVSSSSRSIEFPIHKIKAIGSVKILNSHTKEYSMPWGKNIRIVDDGFPVNFRNFSLPNHISDLMFCQISFCIHKLLNQKLPKGLHSLSIREEINIADLWIKSYTG